MGSALAILKGIASALGLADRLEAWLERRAARNQGVADNIAANDHKTVELARDDQNIISGNASRDRQSLIDALRKE